MSKILLSIPDELLHQFDAYCEKYSYERSEFIRRLLREKLFKAPPASGSPIGTAVTHPVGSMSEEDIGAIKVTSTEEPEKVAEKKRIKGLLYV